LRFNWSQRREPYRGRQQDESQIEGLAGRAERRCMAVASSCREVSCQVRQRSRPTLPVATEEFSKGHSGGTAVDKTEEGVGYGRSVCPESSGPHASCNGWDSGLRPRKGEAIPKPNLSLDRGLKPALVNNGIPSNRASSARGEYVPAPCTHRPSFHSSGVRVRRGLVGCVES
jgi:hypothetical protein